MTLSELYAQADYKDNMGMMFNGDCIDIMNRIGGGRVDLILCDLPYGTTKNKWDSVIPLDVLWEQYERIIKPNGVIVLFSQTPFDKILGCSNLDMLKYEWIWEKGLATGFLNSKFCPLKAHENILVFSKAAGCYVKDKSKAMTYNPQMSEGKPYKAKNSTHSTNYGKMNDDTITINEGTRYPRDVIKFSHDKDKLHPTQKPLALCEYMVKTYSNEGDIVLDNCMGSGTTCVAAKRLSRRYIGIELDKKYYDIAVERIKNET